MGRILGTIMCFTSACNFTGVESSVIMDWLTSVRLDQVLIHVIKIRAFDGSDDKLWKTLTGKYANVF